MCDLYWQTKPVWPSWPSAAVQQSATDVAQDARRGHVAIAHPTHQPKEAIKQRLGYHLSLGGSPAAKVNQSQ